jgi:hypothetical protein
VDNAGTRTIVFSGSFQGGTLFDGSGKQDPTTANLTYTLQQSFTRLCLGWIEYVASNEYRTDARNEDSKAICMKMLHSFRREMAAEGYTQETLDLMSKPSGYCSHV